MLNSSRDRRIAVLLALAGLALIAGIDLAQAQSPLGIGAAEPGIQIGGPFAGLFLWVNQHQQAFYRALTGALKAMRENPWALTSLIGLSFAYGIFHAAGPGHGKAVISSYMIASETALRRGIFLSFVSSLLQAFMAIAVVALAWLVLRGTGISMGRTAGWMETASFALVLFFGLWLLTRKLPLLFRRRDKTPTAVSALFGPAAPQRPLTRKGRIRAEMERRLEAASADVPVLIVRAGDFFGPSVGNSWFGQGIVKPGRPLTAVTYPGNPEAGHAFTYLPDLAETFAELIERADELPAFARFHFQGHDFARGIEIAERVRMAAGRPDLPIRRFPWWAITLASPIVETFRELLEMRYLWRETVRLDNRSLVAFLGREPHTQTDEALRATLAGLSCMPAN